MDIRRRELLRFAAVGLVGAGPSTGPVHRSSAREADLRAPFDVRSFGATADQARSENRDIVDAFTPDQAVVPVISPKSW